jgi:hypothetical protein
MKLQFTSKSKEIAKKFAEHIKAERKLDSATLEKDGVYTVEYSIANCCEVKTEPCSPTYEDLSNVVNYVMREMQYQVNWLSAEISYLFEAMYKHSQGHLPPISGAEKMKKAIEVLGIGGDYDVQKPIIYASAKHGVSMDVDISFKK